MTPQQIRSDAEFMLREADYYELYRRDPSTAKTMRRAAACLLALADHIDLLSASKEFSDGRTPHNYRGILDASIARHLRTAEETDRCPST